MDELTYGPDPSWETNNHSHGLKIPLLSLGQKFHYDIHKSAILSLFETSPQPHILYVLRSILTLSFRLCLSLSSSSLSSAFLDKISCPLLIYLCKLCVVPTPFPQFP